METSKARRHLIISGTGRAGTTFLVQLLTKLNFDTGFSQQTGTVHANCNAGMELDIRQANAPYIVKNPWLCEHLAKLLDSHQVVVDHAIVPIRDLFSAAESRRDVTRRTDPSLYPDRKVPGGLWRTVDPIAQEEVLTSSFYKLVFTLTKFDIPTTFLYFPRLILEPVYLYAKLPFLFATIHYSLYLEAYYEIARPELIHDFPHSEA